MPEKTKENNVSKKKKGKCRNVACRMLQKIE